MITEFIKHILVTEGRDQLLTPQAYAERREAVKLFVSMLMEDAAARIAHWKDHYAAAGISTAHDPTARIKKPASVINFWAKKDPTEEKSYMGRVLQWYNKGKIKQSDHPRVTTALQNFSNLTKPGVNKLAVKDINQYKSLEHLEIAVEPHIPKPWINGSRVVHNSPELAVHEIDTLPAMKRVGCKDDNWCVRTQPKTYWKQYRNKGTFFLIHDKTVPQGERHEQPTGYPNKHFLYHPEQQQLADEHDKALDGPEIADKHPILNKLFHLKSSHFVDPDMLEHDLKNPNPHVLSKLGNIAQHTKSEKVMNLIAPYEARNLVYNPNAPSHLVDKLADNEDPYITRQIASHPNASPETMTKLVTKHPDDTDMLTRIGGNERTPPAVLDQLAGHHDRYVAKAVLRNPNTPASATDKLINHPDSSVVNDVARYATSPDVLQKFTTTHYAKPDLMMRIANNDSAPTAVVNSLANHPDSGVSAAALNHPNLSPSIIKDKLNDPNEAVVHSSMTRLWNNRPDAHNYNVVGQGAEPFMDEYAKHPNPVVNNWVADHYMTSAKTLGSMADNPDEKTAISIFSHNNATPEIMDKVLAHHADNLNVVRHAAGCHTSAEALAKLAGHHDEEVVKNVAGNTDTSPETLTGLAKHTSLPVVRAVAGNSSTPVETRTALTTHADPEVSSSAWHGLMDNVRDLPPEAMEKLANHPDPAVRRQIYQGYNTPDSLKAKMRATQLSNVLAGKEPKSDMYDAWRYHGTRRPRYRNDWNQDALNFEPEAAAEARQVKRFINRLLA